MADFAQSQPVQFVSPIQSLCNQEGCRLSTSDNLLIPMGLDDSHLTKEGSIFFVNSLLKFTVLKND